MNEQDVAAFEEYMSKKYWQALLDFKGLCSTCGVEAITADMKKLDVSLTLEENIKKINEGLAEAPRIQLI